MQEIKALESHIRGVSQTLEGIHRNLGAGEAFLNCKAGINWLSLGDHNSASFHRMVKVTRNSIKCLFDDQGNQIEDMQEICNLDICIF